MGQRESTASVQAGPRIVGYNQEYRWPSEHAHTKIGGAVTADFRQEPGVVVRGEQ